MRGHRAADFRPTPKPLPCTASLAPLTALPNPLASPRFVTLLRSSLLISLVSLLVFSGYASEFFCDCHHEHGQEMTEHGQPSPANGDGCQCVCHQAVSDVLIAPPQTEAAVCTVQAVIRHADEFPPDAVPLGIEHPPQIA
jgi:hypothetical protein